MGENFERCDECGKITWAKVPVASTYDAVSFIKLQYALHSSLDFWEELPVLSFQYGGDEDFINMAATDTHAYITFGPKYYDQVQGKIDEINKRLVAGLYFKNMPERRFDAEHQPFFYYLLREGEPEYRKMPKEIVGESGKMLNFLGSFGFELDEDYKPSRLLLQLDIEDLEDRDIFFEVVVGNIVLPFTLEDRVVIGPSS